jgi:hypothetical protein
MGVAACDRSFAVPASEIAREFWDMKICLSFATISLSLLSASVQATSLCRWVDESGRTQIAEVVPEKYRKVAVCTDSQKYELSAGLIAAAVVGMGLLATAGQRPRTSKP